MKMDSKRTFILDDESQTISLAAKFAHVIQSGLVIFMQGDLGAGKTTFVRGLLQSLGPVGKVKSPTYTLVEPYVISGYNIYHFDLYRFNDPDEWEAAGFRDYFSASHICIVEWPEKASQLLPTPDIEIRLSPHAQGRLCKIVAQTEIGIDILNHLEGLV